MSDLEHIVMKSRDAAAGGRGVLSTGEALAAALVLNRPDWLAEMGYTIAEALQRIGPEWVALIPQAAKALERANESLAEAARTSRQEAALKSMGRRRGSDLFPGQAGHLRRCTGIPQREPRC